MTTEGDNREDVTADQFGQELLEYVQKAEFGTPQYQAISDYLELDRLNDMYEGHIDDLQQSQGEPKESLKSESSLRVTEHKIALLEHEINQSRSRVSGYHSAYKRLDHGFEELSRIAAGEAAEKFEGELKQDSYMQRITNDFFVKVREAVKANRERI